MADFLKARHDLLALRVTLPIWEDEPSLEMVLEDHRHAPVARATWRVPLRDGDCADLESASRIEPRLTEMVNGVQAWLKLLALPKGMPLWIHLVRPYGYCGAINWEGVLAPRLGRPVLRLPDFVERSREDPDVLDIAICCAAGDVAADVCAPLIDKAIEAALTAPRAQIRAHVFASESVLARLQSKPDQRVRLYRPEPAPMETDVSAAPREQRSWLSWIASAMTGRGLDAVHFLAAAEERLERGTLLVSSLRDPGSPSPAVMGIERAELTDFLARTGAWAAIFTSPAAEAGLPLRYLVDSLAQVRAAPALMMDAEAVTEGGLRGVYRFLFSAEPTDPPQIGHGLLYCQPALVKGLDHVGAGAESGAWEAMAIKAERAPLPERILARMAHLPLAPDVELPAAPAWVSATQRFVEQTAMERRRQELFLDQVDAAPDSIEAIRQAATVVDRTLVEIQEIIDGAAANSETGA